MMKQKQKKTESKRYVIYTRCSTDDQAQGDYTTLDAQAHHCKNMLDAFGYELAKTGNNGIINDDGYSGKDLNRPGIQKILENVICPPLRIVELAPCKTQGRAPLRIV